MLQSFRIRRSAMIVCSPGSTTWTEISEIFIRREHNIPAVKATWLSRLDCYEVQLPVRTQVYTMSQGRALTAFTTIVVGVEAEDGTAGFGESCRGCASGPRRKFVHHPGEIGVERRGPASRPGSPCSS